MSPEQHEEDYPGHSIEMAPSEAITNKHHEVLIQIVGWDHLADKQQLEVVAG
jgi:hypothetical protein